MNSAARSKTDSDLLQEVKRAFKQVTRDEMKRRLNVKTVSRSWMATTKASARCSFGDRYEHEHEHEHAGSTP